MRFTLDHGHDAGGLQRHVFSEFGKGLPDLLSISAAADTLAAARALFERNIAAIQAKDRDAYLACYRADDALIRVGPEGAALGFARLRL